MILSEELKWRGFLGQTTYKDLSQLDGHPITFYWGVDPSSDSMTIGNLAAAMMVKTFTRHGHKPVLLIGGATGLIGDPDGKSQERSLKSIEEIAKNKTSIVRQYKQIFGKHKFALVDNYDWFKDMGYLHFLREIGKHVPLRQMLAREFVQTRLSEAGGGISYAEFSYVLIQAYDFYHLNSHHGVTLQVCGSDQWGNSIAGVDLIRRLTGKETQVYSVPLLVNPATGVKFGKTEGGAIWLDPAKTSPTQFYQFWINIDDDSALNYLKFFTELDKPKIEEIMKKHQTDRAKRLAQTLLAEQVTTLVHGEKEMKAAQAVTECLTGKIPIGKVDKTTLSTIRRELASVKTSKNGSIIEALVGSGLANSKSAARQLLTSQAISLNNLKVARDNFEPADFQNGRLLIRRGKAFKDSALVELGKV
ncbi:MAG TPA: tyrosine--tRNA ligase [Candidatus Binatia bacterium]|nr:tyrosine--tRNA ligase [Candidatus Binatia bacterium]